MKNCRLEHNAILQSQCQEGHSSPAVIIAVLYLIFIYLFQNLFLYTDSLAEEVVFGDGKVFVYMGSLKIPDSFKIFNKFNEKFSKI